MSLEHVHDIMLSQDTYQRCSLALPRRGRSPSFGDLVQLSINLLRDWDWFADRTGLARWFWRTVVGFRESVGNSSAFEIDTVAVHERANSSSISEFNWFAGHVGLRMRL